MANSVDLNDKLFALGAAAENDLCGSGCGVRPKKQGALDRCVYHAQMAGGRTVRLLKVLQTSVCRNDCGYCFTRASGSFQRLSFSPDELAAGFMAMLARRQVEGIFISSGIAGSPVGAMDRLLATAELLRKRHQFKGYLHLKIMPGAAFSQVEAAVGLADRVSLNLEAPNPAALSRIAGAKLFQEDMWTRLQWVGQLAARGQGPRAGQTTQFVVGAAGETDLELLTTTDRLYREIHLARAYFSAFRPVKGTPLEHVPPTPTIRQRRLYQADFLLRQYGFALSELVFGIDGDLPSSHDPKLAWALRHPERFPVELNHAGRDDLLRVPGIGPRAAARILAMKREGRLKDPGVLKAAGATVARAAPFVLLDGAMPFPRQATFF